MKFIGYYRDPNHLSSITQDTPCVNIVSVVTPSSNFHGKPADPSLPFEL